MLIDLRTRPRTGRIGWRQLLALPIGLMLLGGCDSQPDDAPSATRAPGPAAYGEPRAVSREFIPRIRPYRPARNAWQNAAFSCVQTELSPATLYHCSGKYLGLFTDMRQYGLGGPTHLACSTPNGPRSYRREAVPDATVMVENWVLVWFAGAKGWTNWDSPWAVFLQHKPASFKLNASGLHFEFPDQAGEVVVMPLYGYAKLPLEGQDVRARYGRTGKIRDTWRWIDGLRTETLMRLRYWASATRQFPLYCEDSFQIDRGRDQVTIRQRFVYHSIPDDWQTRPMKIAPISPPLAQALKDPDFPGRLSAEAMDFDLPTPYGPYMGVQDTEQYDVTLDVLQYVHETELATPPETNAHPAAAAAWNNLRAIARMKFAQPGRDVFGPGTTASLADSIQRSQWYAKALPYLDADTRANAIASLRRFFQEQVLVTNRFRRHAPALSHPDVPRAPKPTSQAPAAFAAADPFNATLLEALWAYAHFTGDWDLIRSRWTLVREAFLTPGQCRWAAFGGQAIVALGDAAAPCLTFARLAYLAGDMEAYQYGCSLFARELVHHWVKQRGVEYCRRHQPWQTMDAMDAEVYLTQLADDIPGWQIDGPHYPKTANRHLYVHRWRRFYNGDVARFYRDFLQDDVRRELANWQPDFPPTHQATHAQLTASSLAQLRSLLLNASPEALTASGAPDPIAGPPAGDLARCLAILRTSHPARWQRLIPAGAPGGFVTGLERDIGGPNAHLVQSVRHHTEARTGSPDHVIWPLPTWRGWTTPTGDRWNFGHVQPSPDRPPGPVRVEALNWNTQAVLYDELREP